MLYRGLRCRIERLERKIRDLEERHNFDMRCLCEELGKQKDYFENMIKLLTDLKEVKHEQN